MVKAAMCRQDGSDTTTLRRRAENSDISSVWVAKRVAVTQNEIVDVLRTNAMNEDGFACIRTSENVEGFVRSDYIKIIKCPMNRADGCESTMLRCRPENSQKSNVWVQNKVCVAQNEEIEVLRVHAAGEFGWAFVRTAENVEGYLRAEYVGAPSAEILEELAAKKNCEANGEQHADILGKRDESGQVRRTSSRVAAAPAPAPSATLHKFFSKAPPLKSLKSDDDSPPTPRKFATAAAENSSRNDEEAIRRSSRARAPPKFLVNEMETPALDKWLQKGSKKPEDDADDPDNEVGDAIARDVVVDEERPLGDYLMKLRT